MQFPKWNQQPKNPEPSSTLKHPTSSLHHHQNFLHNIHTNCSNFLQNLSTSLQHHHQNLNLPPFNPQHAFQTLRHHANQKIEQTITSILFPQHDLPWARVFSQTQSVHQSNPYNQALSTEAIEERLAGVPVYALSNSAEEFVLISGLNTGKSLGLLCFKEEDAEALLEQMRTMNPDMRRGSKVIPVALNKAIQLKLKGVAFRFIPDPDEVKNALKEMKKAGFPDGEFYGVPVFQSEFLILRSQKKRYRPAFFRKEDLENSLLRASQQQNQLNPLLKQGAIQVSVLEDIIEGMKESSKSMWDDVVFIPPGFDVSTKLPDQEKTNLPEQKKTNRLSERSPLQEIARSIGIFDENSTK